METPVPACGFGANDLRVSLNTTDTIPSAAVVGQTIALEIRVSVDTLADDPLGGPAEAFGCADFGNSGSYVLTSLTPGVQFQAVVGPASPIPFLSSLAIALLGTLMGLAGWRRLRA